MTLLFQLISRPTHQRQKALACFQQNYHLGLFFAMRSCENIRVNGPRRTLPVRPCDFLFSSDGILIPLSSPGIIHAKSISITFRFQKNNSRNQTVTLDRTGQVLCPVLAAAAIIIRFHSDRIPLDQPIYSYRSSHNNICSLHSKDARRFLSSFIQSIDYQSFNISPSRIGLHSLRSSAAMAMYINNIPTHTIKYVGRWRSNAFLYYIREQVSAIHAGVASRMLLHPHFVYNVTAPPAPDA